MQSREFNELENRLNGLRKELAELMNEIHSLKTESELVLSNRIKESGKETASIEKEQALKEKEIEQKKQQIDFLKEEQAKLEVKMQEFLKENKKLLNEKEKLLEEQAKLNDSVKNLATNAGILESEKQELLVDLGRVEVRLQDLEEEAKEFKNIELLAVEDINKLRDKVPSLDDEIRSLGAVNLKAIDAFEEFGDELVEVREKSAKLEEEKNAVMRMIKEIDVKRDSAFSECFYAIAKNFSEIYANLAGTEGKLDLTEGEEHSERGLIIEARYSEGKLKSIDLMSGGEKSLTALTFLFAIQHYDAAPFYIFDEADAALDKENSMKLAKMVKMISKNTQFIAITHNDLMLQEADQLIGVALNKDKSSVVGLKLKQEIMPEQQAASA
jgi:chromosome segregation protein